MLKEHQEKRWLMSLREVTAVSLLLAGTSMKSAMAKIGINITNVIHWYDTKKCSSLFLSLLGDKSSEALGGGSPLQVKDFLKKLKSTSDW